MPVSKETKQSNEVGEAYFAIFNYNLTYVRFSFIEWGRKRGSEEGV